MNPYFIPHAIALFAAALLALGLAFRGWSRREAAGARAFALLMLAVALWSSATALENLALDLSRMVFWAKIEYVGIVSVAPLWLMTALGYTGGERWLTSQRLAALWVIPIITLLVAMTNEWHRLLWSRIVPVNDAAGNVVYEHGPWFWIAAGYNYLLIAAGAIVVVRALVRSREAFRAQGAMLLLGLSFPWLGNLIYLAGWSPIPGLDLTPFGFLATGLLVEWNLSRFRLFDLVPVARDTLIEGMRDGVLVLDRQNRVVDINPAARQLLKVDAALPIGQSIEVLLANEPTLTSYLLNEVAPETELLLEGAASRTVEVRVSSLYHRRGRFTGRLVILRDVTERKRMESALQQANDRLQVQVSEIEGLHATVREQAIRDSLTGLFNRRYLEESLDREVSRAEREGRPLSVVMMDIDRFKELNDSYGHAAGDLILRGLGDLLREHTRRGDIACRYGGEEFVVVLPGASLDVALQKANQLCSAFENLGVQYDQNLLQATLSLGVATFPHHGSTADVLLRRADEALYAAKTAGRNRVLVQQTTAVQSRAEHQ